MRCSVLGAHKKSIVLIYTMARSLRLMLSTYPGLEIRERTQEEAEKYAHMYGQPSQQAVSPGNESENGQKMGANDTPSHPSAGGEACAEGSDVAKPTSDTDGEDSGEERGVKGVAHNPTICAGEGYSGAEGSSVNKTPHEKCAEVATHAEDGANLDTGKMSEVNGVAEVAGKQKNGGNNDEDHILLVENILKMLWPLDPDLETSLRQVTCSVEERVFLGERIIIEELEKVNIDQKRPSSSAFKTDEKASETVEVIHIDPDVSDDGEDLYEEKDFGM